MSCVVCGKPKGRNKKACSMSCYVLLKQNYKTCIICSSVFPSPPSANVKTCSPACSTVNRKRMAEQGVFNSALQRAHKRLPHSPLTGRFDTHMHAKEWVIQSPNGDVYKCRNLLKWCRDHEHLFDGTARQAWDGFTKIKYSAQGKRKRPINQWKGWRLLEWEE